MLRRRGCRSRISSAGLPVRGQARLRHFSGRSRWRVSYPLSQTIFVTRRGRKAQEAGTPALRVAHPQPHNYPGPSHHRSDSPQRAILWRERYKSGGGAMRLANVRPRRFISKPLRNRQQRLLECVSAPALSCRPFSPHGRFWHRGRDGASARGPLSAATRARPLRLCGRQLLLAGWAR